ncbi:hypothetical protein [Burkholderia territorii]|nr:hypothetical protein [Burkholderia territorii]
MIVTSMFPTGRRLSFDEAAVVESSVGVATIGKNAIAPNAVFCCR